MWWLIIMIAQHLVSFCYLKATHTVLPLTQKQSALSYLEALLWNNTMMYCDVYRLNITGSSCDFYKKCCYIILVYKLA